MIETPLPLLPILHLSAPGQFREIPGALGGRPSEVCGQSAHYYRKDLISVGDYTNKPKGFSLAAPRSRLKTFLKAGKAMLADGVPIPIVVDHLETAESARGKIVDFELEGDTLYGICQLIGDESPLLAARNLVSVGVNPNYTAGNGKSYGGDVIQHVALTPLPVVPGQSNFVQAASLAAAGGDVLTLAAVSPPTKGVRMRTLNCSEADMDCLHSEVPGLAEKSDDDGSKCSHILAHVRKGNKAVDKESKTGEDDTKNMSLTQDLSTANDHVTTLSAENESLRATIQELSAAIPEPVSESSLFLMSQFIKTEREVAIAGGGIDPATAKLIDALTMTGEGTPTIQALSMTAAKTPLAVEFWRALRGNKPISVDPKAGVQALSMSPAPVSKPTEDAANAAEIEATRKLLHLPPTK